MKRLTLIMIITLNSLFSFGQINNYKNLSKKIDFYYPTKNDNLFNDNIFFIESASKYLTFAKDIKIDSLSINLKLQIIVDQIKTNIITNNYKDAKILIDQNIENFTNTIYINQLLFLKSYLSTKLNKSDIAIEFLKISEIENFELVENFINRYFKSKTKNIQTDYYLKSDSLSNIYNKKIIENHIDLNLYSELLDKYCYFVIVNEIGSKMFNKSKSLRTVHSKKVISGKKYWESKLYKPKKQEKLFPVVACDLQHHEIAKFDKKSIWTNQREIEGNNIDDDNNGIVDDIYGIYDSFDSTINFKPIELDFNKFNTEVLSNFTDFYVKVNGYPKDLLKAAIFDHGTMSTELLVKNNPSVKVMAIDLNFINEMNRNEILFTNDTIANRKLVTAIIDKIGQKLDFVANYLLKNNVKVVEINSFSFYYQRFYHEKCGSNEKSILTFLENCMDKLKKQFEHFYNIASQTLFVNGAGNHGGNIDENISSSTFIKLNNVILSGALFKNMKKASYSAFGKDVLFSPAHFELEKTISIKESNGTSASSPILANLAILLFSLNPNLTPEQVKTYITNSSENSPFEEGINIINPKKAVEMMKKDLL